MELISDEELTQIFHNSSKFMDALNEFCEEDSEYQQDKNSAIDMTYYVDKFSGTEKYMNTFLEWYFNYDHSECTMYEIEYKIIETDTQTFKIRELGHCYHKIKKENHIIAERQE